MGCPLRLSVFFAESARRFPGSQVREDRYARNFTCNRANPLLRCLCPRNPFLLSLFRGVVLIFEPRGAA